jgi:hypothetical protein
VRIRATGRTRRQQLTRRAEYHSVRALLEASIPSMDPQSIDQAYNQLQQEFNEVAGTLQTLAGKLSTAAAGGDPHAQEWLLDLKGLALNIKSEQMQAQNLLSQIHAFVDNQHQQYSQQMPAYQQQYGQGGRRGGLGGLLNSNFGRAIEWGAGFGIGDDLINNLF